MTLRVILFVLFVLGAIAGIVVWLMRQAARFDEAASWPETEGTIQSVSKVAIRAGRASVEIDVCDFSYIVNGEYNSGRLRVSHSSSTGDSAPRNLINQKIRVRCNPQKPSEYLFPQQKVEGFLLDPYDVSSGRDIDPIDLNLDKI